MGEGVVKGKTLLETTPRFLARVTGRYTDTSQRIGKKRLPGNEGIMA